MRLTTSISKIYGSLGAIVLTAAICLPTTGHAATYHVSTNGDDRKGDGSEEQPWRSLQKAANRVKRGDHVVVAEGTYAPFHITTSGEKSARISFAATKPSVRIEGYEYYDGRYVGISVLASYVTIEGFEVDVGEKGHSRSRGIRVSGVPGRDVRDVHIVKNRVTNAGWVGITTSYAEGVRIEGNRVWNSRGQHGIYVANSADNPVIRGNVAFGNAQAGIQVNADPGLPGDGVIEGAVIENNVLYRNGRKGSAALNLASVRNSRIVGNLLYQNFSQGMASWDDDAGAQYGCKNNVYANNTVVMPEGAHHALSFRHGSTGNTVYNNILLHLGGRDSIAVDSNSLSGLTSDHNIATVIEDSEGRLVSLSQWQQTTGLDRSSFPASPAELFLRWVDDDYTLSPGSPAIDKGKPRPDITRDITGATRPQGKAIDIGAYEHPGT